MRSRRPALLLAFALGAGFALPPVAAAESPEVGRKSADGASGERPSRSDPPTAAPAAPATKPDGATQPAAAPRAPATSIDDARTRAEDARRRAREAADRKQPAAAPPSAREPGPENPRAVPRLPITSAPQENTVLPTQVSDVEWEVQGLSPCDATLPCPGLEGQLTIPMNDFNVANGQVNLHVSEWAGYKALTFHVVEPDSPRVTARFGGPKSLDTQTVQWATAGSDVPVFIGLANEGGPAAWDLSVSVQSGVEPAVTRQFRVILGPPVKVASEVGEEADAEVDCDILTGACGAELRPVTVDGNTFAQAVWAASAADGATPFEIESGVCNHDGSVPIATVGLPPVGGICEFKLFTGGLSHSRMRKHCLIESWEATEPYQHALGWEVAILDAPDPWSRQKQWHVRLTGAPTSPTFQSAFSVYWVNLRVPQDAPDLTATDDATLRDYCFE